MKLNTETYIMAFKDLYDWDEYDNFEDDRLLERINNSIDDYEFDEIKPTEEEMADVVKQALYDIQYGDTDDIDDLIMINDDYYERFPNGR